MQKADKGVVIFFARKYKYYVYSEKELPVIQARYRNPWLVNFCSKLLRSVVFCIGLELKIKFIAIAAEVESSGSCDATKFSKLLNRNSYMLWPVPKKISISSKIGTLYYLDSKNKFPIKPNNAKTLVSIS